MAVFENCSLSLLASSGSVSSDQRPSLLVTLVVCASATHGIACWCIFRVFRVPPYCALPFASPTLFARCVAKILTLVIVNSIRANAAIKCVCGVGIASVNRTVAIARHVGPRTAKIHINSVPLMSKKS